MKMRILLIAVFLVVTGFLIVRQQDRNYYDLINAVSGATPLAVARDVPGDPVPFPRTDSPHQ